MPAAFLVAVLAIVLLWPAAAGSETPPSLTLQAPGATTFGHRIQFVGRLTPAAAGARVRLYRGEQLVAAAATRPNGVFRVPVQIARPGPFRVGWAGVFSPDVTVRIHPFLDASLTGRRMLGSPLGLVARLRPQEAGAIRVRVFRNDKQTFAQTFQTEARVQLAGALGRLKVRIESVPAPGYAGKSRDLGVRLRLPSLRYGTTGPAVSELARRLADLHYAIPRVSSTFDADFLQSVYAFQKAQGLERTGVVDAAFWRRLEHPLQPAPRYRKPASHIEVDKPRQVLYLVRGGKIALIVPVSTGGIAGYYTPVGRFAIYRKVAGYDPSPLGVLYDPMYFYGGYAIHGNPSVPPYPASHGCIRVPNFVIVRLFASEPYGETVYVY